MNLLLILPDWYCRKSGLTDSPSHDGELTSDRKMICNSYQSYKIENSDYRNHFSVIFETTSKFVIVFCKIVIGKSGRWRIYRATTKDWRQLWTDFKSVFKGLLCKQRLLHSFLIKFPSNKQICHCFWQIDFAESWGWRTYRPRRESGVR